MNIHSAAQYNPNQLAGPGNRQHRFGGEKHHLKPQSLRYQGIIDQWMIKRELRDPVDTTLPDFVPSQIAAIPENEKYVSTILSLIAQAKDSIKIDCFYIGGEAGEKILKAIQKKAEEGVKIYYRGDICQGLDNKEQVTRSKNRLHRYGRNLSRFFYTEHYRRDPFQVVGVNHNKLFIIDNHTAFVSTKNPCQGDLDNRDVSLVMRGPVVADLTKHFDRNWLYMTREKLDDRVTSKPEPLPKEIEERFEVQECRPVVTSHYKRNSLQAMLSSIQNAKHSVQLHGFALTNREIMNALVDAAKRGLQVQVLLDNHETYPFRMPNSVVFGEFLKLSQEYPNLQLKAYKHQIVQNTPNPGRKLLHRYKNHNKMLLVDGNRAIVGSTNFTNADVWHQENISMELKGGRSTDTMNDLFKNDWALNSVPVKPLGFLERIAAFLLKTIYEF